MVGAGLVARKALERGLSRKPWVKTSLAPGSKVVTEYLEKAGLMDDLEALGFYLVGYGCTTCIGNSSHFPGPISEAIAQGDLVVASVLSGNRNFEGRIHPEVRANYLGSPPLVVAYALAGTVDIDLTTEPIGTGSDGEPVYSAISGQASRRSPMLLQPASTATSSPSSTAESSRGPTSGGRSTLWAATSPGRQRGEHLHPGSRPSSPTWRRHPGRSSRSAVPGCWSRWAIRGDHRSHQPGRFDQAGLARRSVPDRARCERRRLQQLRVTPGQRPGDDKGGRSPTSECATTWPRGPRGGGQPTCSTSR